MMKVQFDHIEVHVENIEGYCRYLERLFEGGCSEVISKTGTSMFTSNDGVRIEVKRKKNGASPIESGFCNPCLKRSSAKEFIDGLGLAIERVRDTEAGPVFFFKDHEGVLWHMKDIA